MIAKPTHLLAMLLLAAMMMACSKSEDSAHVVETHHSTTEAKPSAEVTRLAGECHVVFEGELCSWSESQSGELLTFGVTIPMATVENAPNEGNMVFPPVTWARVGMPQDVKDLTGIDHLGVNWEVHGHPPKTFMTPHFDFHFYTTTGEYVEAIDCSDLTKPETLPEGYVMPDQYIEEMNMMLVGLCVPQMGMHAVNAEEGSAEDYFDVSMIVGYILGELIFIEPMIAKHHLMKRESFAVAIPELGERGEGLVNPAAFEARFDPERDAYELMFSMASVP